MNITKHIILATILTATGLTARAQSILDISPTIHSSIRDTSIVYPESFETDVHKMMENWYLRNYAELDRQADERRAIVATDDEIIERLGLMNTVIEMPYNSIVRNYIDLYTGRRQQLVENMLGMSLYYMPIFIQALDRHGLPLELRYLPVIESALNPTAVSRAGATGLWQFMTATASGLGLEINSLVDQRRDPYASSEAAAVYLKQLYEMFGDWSLAIAAYNCGPGNINKALRRAGGGKKDFWELYPFLPAETRGYVPAFIAANYVMNFYNCHNISPALARKPLVTDTINVSRRVHFDQISEVLDIPVDEIRALNPQFRTDVIPGNVKPYSLVLPSMQVYAYLANEDSIANHNASRYGRRDRVEPSDGSISGSDDKGEYIEELTVKYHTVRKGETLTSIAKKYGVTVNSIRDTNKIGKSVRRGQRLKINTYKRRYIESTPQPVGEPIPMPVDTLYAPTDSVPVVAELGDSTLVAMRPAEYSDSIPSEEVTPKAEEVKPMVKQPEKPVAQPRRHKVKRGETLSKISRHYGVSIQAIKNANNLKSDNINVGQTLKIPVK